MVRRTFVSLVFVALILSACVSGEQKVADAGIIKVSDDQFRPYRQYTATNKQSIHFSGTERVTLAARIDRKTGATVVMAEIAVFYMTHERRHYDRAANAQAEPLIVNKIAYDGQCDRKKNCERDEVVQVQIPEAVLRQVPSAGYQFKIFGKAAPDILISLEKPLIDSLFLKIDADRAKPPTQISQKSAL